MSTATIPANPLMPSIILSTCVQPPTATTVKTKEIGQNDNSQSAHSTSTRITPPNSHQAIAAEANAASSRIKEPTSFLISSTTPAPNTGHAAMNKTGHNQANVTLLGPKTKPRQPAGPNCQPTHAGSRP